MAAPSPNSNTNTLALAFTELFAISCNSFMHPKFYVHAQLYHLQILKEKPKRKQESNTSHVLASWRVKGRGLQRRMRSTNRSKRRRRKPQESWKNEILAREAEKDYLKSGHREVENSREYKAKE
ncbi:hypothetical protein AMTR_s00032p00131530 [Amborella trichopoda]|uniref:Uncharacterized protein n=1 Tax=Amborella trichopoda TaxID=13333 RepID=U5D399_AMBTC|nr:hypothetical protein AMTR_s00032p00131530 [Amborella trichopoda]